jgi:hypothetical protein
MIIDEIILTQNSWAFFGSPQNTQIRCMYAQTEVYAVVKIYVTFVLFETCEGERI